MWGYALGYQRLQIQMRMSWQQCSRNYVCPLVNPVDPQHASMTTTCRFFRVINGWLVPEGEVLDRELNDS
jgi:hypothetical protein